MISFSFYLLRININQDISSCVRFTGGAYNKLRKDGQDEQLSELFTYKVFNLITEHSLLPVYLFELERNRL